jgi:hypothetical protein
LGGSLGLLGLLGLPVGKALTGFTVGYLTRILKIDGTKHSSWMVGIASLLGYVPEALFTLFYFESLVVILLPDVAASFTSWYGSMHLLALSILTKAWIEITLLSVFMATLVGNNGFNDFVNRVFTRPAMITGLKQSKPD